MLCATRSRILRSSTTAAAAAAVARTTSTGRMGRVGAIRCLNVHEYVSMELMKAHGITTPECYVADTPEEAEHIATTSLNRRT